MGYHRIYADQNMYDEEDAYMDEYYDHDPYIKELEPEPPDYVRYSSSQHMCYEERTESGGELIFKPESIRSSSWSRSHKTSQTPNSMVHFNSSGYYSPNKIQLYAFSGKRSYLEWERNMDDWFYYNYIRKEERLDYAVGQLTGEAYKWWLQENETRRFYYEPAITTWEHLKKLLRDQFVPKDKSKAHIPMKHPCKEATASTDPRCKKSVNKQADKSKETSINGKNELFGDAFMAEMKQIINAGFASFHQELRSARYKPQKEHSQAKVNDQLNQVISDSSHDVITYLSCPKEAEKGTGEEEKHSALIRPDKEYEQPALRAPSDLAPSVLASKEITITAEFTQPFLLDTKFSETHNLIQYVQNFIAGHSFKYSVSKLSISSIMHLFFPLSSQKETGVLELSISPMPKPTFQPTICEDPNKYCKEIGVISNSSHLFVLITAEEEKRFGLNNVKDFCVSNSVFDNIIQSFEKSEFSNFSRQKTEMPNEFCDSSLILSYNLFRKMLEQDPMTPDYLDIIRLFWSKESNAGIGAMLSCTKVRRSKPPDLEEPPGATSNPTTIFKHLRGNSFTLHKLGNAYVFFIYVGHKDLRTNPLQEGGDDAILTGPYDPGIHDMTNVRYKRGTNQTHVQIKVLDDLWVNQMDDRVPEPDLDPTFDPWPDLIHDPRTIPASNIIDPRHDIDYDSRHNRVHDPRHDLVHSLALTKDALAMTHVDHAMTRVDHFMTCVDQPLTHVNQTPTRHQPALDQSMIRPQPWPDPTTSQGLVHLIRAI